MKRRGLTILEVFIVLAILSILMALLLPAVQATRERAREAVCRNNIRQLNLAVAQFAEVHKQLPTPAPPGFVGGWMVAILPFIEQNNLKDAIPAGLQVADANATLHRPPPVFRCPRRTTLDGESLPTIWPGHYVFVAASGRESFLLFDAPTKQAIPWLIGPELSYNQIIQEQGPHSGGFHFASGFQQGVNFMLNGRQVW